MKREAPGDESQVPLSLQCGSLRRCEVRTLLYVAMLGETQLKDKKAMFLGLCAALAVLPSGFRIGSAASIGMTSEMPTKAQTFLNSIAVDTHFDQYPYNGPQYPQIAKLLENSGIKHIRETVNANPTYVARLNELAANGIHTTIVTSLGVRPEAARAFAGKVSSSIEAIEGPNEPDLSNNPNWPAAMRLFMQRLHEFVKSSPQLARYPILAPSVTNSQEKLGDISQYIDYGNMHNYFSTFNPGTKGWGNHMWAGTYGSIQYNENLARQICGSKPIQSTETGWGSTPSGARNTLDDVVQGKYVSRLYFVQYNAGIVRTFDYEFLDSDKSGQIYTNFGMVDSDLQPKPAYYAVQAIIADLADTSVPFTTTPLRYAASGQLRNVKHTVLEKSDGSYYVALWLEVPGWKDGSPISVAPQRIEITTANPMSSASVMRVNDQGHPSTSELHEDGHHVTLDVTDSVSILKLTPERRRVSSLGAS